jgi:hypothetical protein
MKLFKASDTGIFASASLLGHLLRGVIGAALLWWAWTHQAWPLAGLAAAALALLAWRGCPMCWTLGLLETIKQKFSRTKALD